MKILFINHNQLDSNSGIHIYNLANHLTRLGLECTVCILDHQVDSKKTDAQLFDVISFSEARRNREHRQFDIIHAWTPRECVRLAAEELTRIYACPYVVHLEDNEEALLEASLGESFAKLSHLALTRLDMIIPPHLSHPIRYKEFLGKARGISILMDTLGEFCPPDTPNLVIWPGYEDEMDWTIQPDPELHKQLGIGKDEYVIVYTGNIHLANRREVFSLYLAVGLLNRKGIPTKIIRTGIDFVPLFDETLEILKKDCINLGHVDRSKLPALLSLADVLVQPGKADAYNNYRFPSKLPEFFATGKPVLLPVANIGRFLKDGDECVLLQKGHALEIAQKLEILFNDTAMRKNIGMAGRHFAELNLRWADSAMKMHKFYQRLLELTTESYTIQPATLKAIAITDQITQSQEKDIPNNDNFQATLRKDEMNSNLTSTDKNIQKNGQSVTRTPTILDYATVRDFCDSADHFAHIMRFDGDLKDVQRPWMLKSILGMLPPGAKVLEIGAGEPLVSNALQTLGYDVTIVDPYDGSGNGPQTYTQYVKKYPHIKIVKANFEKDIHLLEKSFDCIFSISVLEHVPHPKLQDVFTGISKFLKKDGCSIHCTDLVIAGQWANWHDEGAREIIFWQSKLQNPDLDEKQIRSQVDDMMNLFYPKMASNLETYYHSAQGHNLWRGGKPYDEFPFRKIVSMQTCAIRFSDYQTPSVT